jgi:cytochrome P450
VLDTTSDRPPTIAARYRWLARLPRQLRRVSPFDGDSQPARVSLLSSDLRASTLPFPHPWNYDRPLEILEAYFRDADRDSGPARHNRYIEVPGFPPVLVTRDPGIIRAITTATGDGAGQFDRDTLPSTGIARATGNDTLLYSNGSTWRRQRKISASPFGKTSLFQPERFQEFSKTLRGTVSARLDALRTLLQTSRQTQHRVALEPEIKAVMLEMLTNCFFGCQVPHEELRNHFVPALERVIDHIVRDTVINKTGISVRQMPNVTRSIEQAKRDHDSFDELTNRVLAQRHSGRGLWSHFKSDAPDEALRSNLKVFLAGALEATTSYASWAVAHLARNAEAQEKVFAEVRQIDDYTPENLERAKYFGYVLDETLRLTPSLYFLPRQATADTWVETADGRRMFIPIDTHILLDVWHANRHNDHWGVAASGFPALDFVPERWERLAALGRGSKDVLHFGFGHGPRVCPGKHLGQLEVALVVGVFVKLFRFSAVETTYGVKAGVSTKPSDGTLVDLELRGA